MRNPLWGPASWGSKSASVISEDFEADFLERVTEKVGYAFKPDVLKIVAEFDGERFQNLYLKSQWHRCSAG